MNNTLYIRRIEPSFNSTNGISADVFLSGCFRETHCKNCHNPELWQQKTHDVMSFEEAYSQIKQIHECYNTNKIAIMGGEPIHQERLSQFLSFLKSKHAEIWLYTSYEIADISLNSLKNCDYIKTGMYMPEAPNMANMPQLPKLASANQHFFHIKNGIGEKII